MRCNGLVLLILAMVAAGASSDAAGQTLLHRVNCGGPAGTDDLGAAFAADQPYSAGGFGHEGGVNVRSIGYHLPNSCGGPDNAETALYLRGKAGWTAYRFDVPDGDYIVRLMFAEVFNQGEGIRSMSIDVEGVTHVSGLDVAGEVGVQFPHDVIVRATVTGNRLDIESHASPGTDPPEVEAALVNGIEIWTAPAMLSSPAAPSNVAALPSFDRVIVSWDRSSDPTVAKYEVRRANSALGPFTPHATVCVGPNRFLDDSAAPPQEYFYQVRAINVDGMSSFDSAVVSATPFATSQSTLPVYEIQIDAANLRYISRNIFDNGNEEVPAQFTRDGVTIPVNVRFRGNSGRWVSKKSWKVKYLNPLDGRRETTLKAAYTDRSMIREPLAYAMYDEAGLQVPRAWPVHLTVNGEYAGVFHEVEQIAPAFFARRNRSQNTELFKCDKGLIQLPVSEYPDHYENSEGTDLSDLIQFINFISPTPQSSFVQPLVDVFDLDRFLTYMAVLSFLGDFDSTNHNFFLALDRSLDRWEVYPYDADTGFASYAGQNPLFYHESEMLPLLTGDGPTAPGQGVKNQLRAIVSSLPELRWRYAQKVTELMQRSANSATLTPLIQSLRNDMEMDALADPFKQGWHSNTEFLASFAGFPSFIAGRTAFLQSEVASHQPLAPPTDVWINELSAAHQTSYLDEMGESEDWVELYNASANPIDISGYFLSDDLSVAPSWTFPTGTIIAPGGYVVVFCDNEPFQGPLHATFKLKSEGEELGFFAADGTTLLDFINWGPQQPNVSYGRYADGKQFFHLLPNQTPGTANDETGNLPPLLADHRRLPTTPTAIDNCTVSVLATDSDGLTVDLHLSLNGSPFFAMPAVSVGEGRYEALIPVQPAGTFVQYYLTSTDSIGKMAILPSDAPVNTIFSYIVLPQASPSGVVINEIMAKNDSTIQDAAGDFDDYVEIYNSTPLPFDLSGYYLTDNFAVLTKWQFPVATSVPAFGTIIVWCDDEALEGPMHATFKLSATGEELALVDPNGFTIRDSLVFGAQLADEAYGSMPDGAAARFRLLDPSPNASNLGGPTESRRFNIPALSRNQLDLIVPLPVAINGFFQLKVQGAAADERGLIAFSQSLGAFDYGVVGVLYIDPPEVLISFTTDSSGLAVRTESVPNVPSFVGFSFYAQAWSPTVGLSNVVQARVGQ